MRSLDHRAERFGELWIVERQDRAPAQLPQEAAEPDRRKRQRQHDVHPADRQLLLVELRRDEPEQIDKPNDHDADRDLHAALPAPA